MENLEINTFTSAPDSYSAYQKKVRFQDSVLSNMQQVSRRPTHNSAKNKNLPGWKHGLGVDFKFLHPKVPFCRRIFQRVFATILT